MKTYALIISLLLSTSSFAQIFDPVKWSYKAIPGKPGEYTLEFTAKIEDGWYVYSQFIADGGPIPTSFSFDKNNSVEFVGKVSEKGDKTKEGFDEMFNMNIKKFAHQAVFEQKVKVKSNTVLSGTLDFMTCNDERCLPPDNRSFTFNLTAQPGSKDAEPTASSRPPVNVKIETQNPDTESSSEQSQEPAAWSVTGKREADQIVLELSVRLGTGWHIYSQNIQEGGPVATRISLEEGAAASLPGKAEEKGPKAKEVFEEVFGMKVKYYEEEVRFIQQLIPKAAEGKVKGTIEFMLCDDSRCLPPEVLEFETDLASGETQLLTAESESMPQKEAMRFGPPISDCGEEADEAKNDSILSIMLLGFLGGLLALITPCVFPMIPLTVSFFTKRSQASGKGKLDALLYAGSIVLIYFLLSVPFLIFDISPDTLNEISTGVPLNVFFFIIFVVFAFSFFGFYEITLPNSIANRAESASDVGGIIGIFFMAVTLAIVSFSCTGPILGTLLVGALSSSGGKLNLVAGMTSFGLALALPFGLFALFPGWLKSLPKSGGWLNTVKVVLGFLELILAIKFLSNADLVAHWGILKREIFLGLWVVLSLGMAAYLFALIRFPHDNPGEKPGAGRIGFGLLSVVFAAYCGWGLAGNDLQLLSGFPPPKFYSLKKQDSHCPHNLACYHDYDEALKAAKLQNKPVMVDFTGWACVNCRKMEENVWIQPEVYKRISEDYILVSLYVDDTKMLPEAEQYVSPFSGKKIRTVGNKWSDMQATYFGNNSQPYYVLLNTEEQLLNKPVGYTPDVQEYLRFLDCGLRTFESGKQAE